MTITDNDFALATTNTPLQATCPIDVSLLLSLEDASSANSSSLAESYQYSLSTDRFKDGIWIAAASSAMLSHVSYKTSVKGARRCRLFPCTYVCKSAYICTELVQTKKCMRNVHLCVMLFASAHTHSLVKSKTSVVEMSMGRKSKPGPHRTGPGPAQPTL